MIPIPPIKLLDELVFVRPRHNKTDPPHVATITITRVGRKWAYFKLSKHSWELQADPVTGTVYEGKGDGRQAIGRLYANEAAYREVEQKQQLWDRIRDAFNCCTFRPPLNTWSVSDMQHLLELLCARDEV